MKKQTIYLTITALFILLTTFGQNQELKAQSSRNSETKVSLQRSIMFDKDSKSEEIVFNIVQKTLQFDIFISSSVSEGKLLIELYDPNNVKQGNYTLGTQLDSEKKEVINGMFQKSLKEPQPGDWVVKIVPSEATGNIKILTNIFE